MLWLGSDTRIKKVSRYNFIKKLDECGFYATDILQSHPTSLVALTSQGIVKITHPQLSKIFKKNFTSAEKKFLAAGILLPKKYRLVLIDGFLVLHSERITDKFLNKVGTTKSDVIFLNFYKKLKNWQTPAFGPIFSEVSLRKKKPSEYLKYWDTQFQHYLKKSRLSKKTLIATQYRYELLKKKLKFPCVYILSHADISPKHLYIKGKSIGCIDIEESMYLDTMFMPALWVTRTIRNRNKKNVENFCKKICKTRKEYDWFNYHLFRETFIQECVERGRLQ